MVLFQFPGPSIFPQGYIYGKVDHFLPGLGHPDPGTQDTQDWKGSGSEAVLAIHLQIILRQQMTGFCGSTVVESQPLAAPIDRPPRNDILTSMFANAVGARAWASTGPQEGWA